MQLVQAWTRLGAPSTTARTRWMFGSHRRLFRLCENVTDLPNHGFLPQISQTAAIESQGTKGSHSAGPVIVRSPSRRSSSEIWPGIVRTSVPSLLKNNVAGGAYRS
jgi:hypothetical protein